MQENMGKNSCVIYRPLKAFDRVFREVAIGSSEKNFSVWRIWWCGVCVMECILQVLTCPAGTAQVLNERGD